MKSIMMPNKGAKLIRRLQVGVGAKVESKATSAVVIGIMYM